MGPQKERYYINHISGSHYEAGERIGRIIGSDPGLLKRAIKRKNRGSPCTFEEYADVFERYSPGINDEIKGCASELKVHPKDMAYYHDAFICGSCSHFSIQGDITNDGHVYVGRSYELSPDMSDRRLIMTNIKGKYSHIGFSEMLFGRDDGMNEKGLCVTMSASHSGLLPKERGFRFWAVIRSVLDNCETVDEGIEKVLEMPSSFYTNYIITEPSGKSALIESFPKKHYVRIMEEKDERGYLLSTNHCVLDEGNLAMKHSIIRHKRIEARLKKGDLSLPRIKGLLSKEYPEGLCCHYYREGLGTLWAEIFDLTDGTVDVCFGSPNTNKWHRYCLDKGIEDEDFFIKLPQDTTSPDLFESVESSSYPLD